MNECNAYRVDCGVDWHTFVNTEQRSYYYPKSENNIERITMNYHNK